MGMPFRYSFRNLFRRRLRTLMTVLGIALVVAASVIMLAYSRGLLHSLRRNGDPENVLAISRKAMDRIFSSMKRGDFEVIRSLLADRAATDPEGRPLIAPFLHHTATVGVAGAGRYGERKLGIIMGVDPGLAPRLVGSWRLTAGQPLAPGQGRVALAGVLAHARLGVDPQELAPGSRLSFNNAEWTVAGTFDTDGTAADSEIWVPLDELSTLLNRLDYSHAVIRLKHAAWVEDTVNVINQSEQAELKAVGEAEFFAASARTFNVFAAIGAILAGIITIGGVMAGMNTMYTAVRGRIREIGMLQVLGFRRPEILMGILVESLLIALAGGLLGAAAGTLVDGLPMRVTMGVFVFRVDGLVLGAGLLMASAIGILGALLPAWRALHLPVVEAMRAA